MLKKFAWGFFALSLALFLYVVISAVLFYPQQEPEGIVDFRTNVRPKIEVVPGRRKL